MNFSVTNQNFKGFSNIISDVKKSEGHELAFIGLKLDNNGTRDLDTYRKFKEEAGLDDHIIESDNLVLTRVSTPGKGEFLMFEDTPIPNGKELLRLERKKDEDFPLIKDLAMKMYTFFADLTLRISESKTKTVDPSKMLDVTVYTKGMLSDNMKNKQAGIQMVCEALLNGDTYKKDAEYFNKVINRRLSVFFK